jgi:hypothetical protein
MSHKRPASSLSDEDTNKNEWGAKKQKTVPHLGKLNDVIADFLDLLSPASPDSLVHFNKRERAGNRGGVDSIDTSDLERELKLLRAMKDEATLDAKLSEIELYLKHLQKQYQDYINAATAEGDSVAALVIPTLSRLISRIQKAREDIPGMFSY